MRVKRGLVRNARVFLLFSFLALLFLLYPGEEAVAQEELGCCYLGEVDGSCYADVTSEQCDVVSGYFHPGSCDEVFVDGSYMCQAGWCCGDEPQYIGKGECLAAGFEFRHGGPDDDWVCEEDDVVSVSGVVRHQDGDVFPNVQVSFNNGVSSVVSTNSVGFYSVTLLPGEDYEVVLYHAPTECEDSFSVSVGHDDETRDFVLDCDEPPVDPDPVDPVDCRIEWVYGDWEVDGDGCDVRERSLTVLNDACDEGPAGTVLDTRVERICPPEDDELNCAPGNPNIENGFDCDPWTGEFAGSVESCTEQGYVGGSLSCSYECEVVPNCFDCPGENNLQECTSEMCDGVCPECEESSICQLEQCVLEDVEVSLDASYLQSEQGVSLSWSFGDSCPPDIVDGQTLTRCDAIGNSNNCEDDTAVEITPNPSATSYEDTDVESNERYCYNLTAQISNGPVERTVSDFQCVNSSSVECVFLEGGEGSYCDGEVIHCDEYRLISRPACSPGQVCAEFGNNAGCFNISLCAECDGPFGFFGANPGDFTISDAVLQSIAHDGDVDGIISGGVSSCPVLREGFSSDEGEVGPLCYLDEHSLSFSSVGHHKACGEIESCYDYRARNSCEDDPCGLAEACSWNDEAFDGAEFGFGFCEPVEAESVDCTKCESVSPTGECDKDLCTAFGDRDGVDRCFYNENPSGKYVIDEYQCMNVEHVGCETYNTPLECVGEGSRSTHFVGFDYYSEERYETPCLDEESANQACIEKGYSGWVETLDASTFDQGCYRYEGDEWSYVAGQNFILNARCFSEVPGEGFVAEIEYDQDGNKIGSTNIIRSNSSDEFGRGKCYWDVGESACFRDADMSRNRPSGYQADCPSDDMSCLLDFEDPVTNMISLINGGSYSSAMVRNMHFEVEGFNARTYFSITRAGQNPSYPDMRLSELRERVDGLDSGEYVLSFFSVDNAQNHEEVQSISFFLVPGFNESFNVTYHTSSRVLGAAVVMDLDVYIRNRDVEGLGDAWDDSMSCTVRLRSTDDDGFSSTRHVEGNSPLITSFNALIDGEYVLSVNCVDSYGQHESWSDIITVELDRTIHGASPRAGDEKTFAPGSIPISLNTEEAAEYCQFSKRKFLSDTGGVWRNFDTNNNLNHSKEIIVEEDGIYLLDTRCSFEDITGYYPGGNAQRIVFAVDGTPPRISITENGDEYNENLIRDEVDLRFDCDPFNPELVHPDYGNMFFPCDDTALFCRFYGNGGSCTPNREAGVGVSRNFTAPPTYFGIGYLNVSMADMGGNEAYKVVKLDLRDTVFSTPRIIIRD